LEERGWAEGVLTISFELPTTSNGGTMVAPVEKKRPHHDLRSIKKELSSVPALRITKTATQCAERLGLTLQDVVGIIQGTTGTQFYKSMTSAGDSAIWQDVYHVHHKGLVLYVKFTVDIDGFLVVSFKEK
jgi:hypothetical protein